MVCRGVQSHAVILCLTYKNKTFFRYILAGFALILLLLIILTPFIPQLDTDHALLEGIFAVRCAARGINCRNNYINAKKRQ